VYQNFPAKQNIAEDTLKYDQPKENEKFASQKVTAE
jgi:hypothetical protein